MNASKKDSLSVKSFLYFSLFSIGILVFLWLSEYAIIKKIVPRLHIKALNEIKENIKTTHSNDLISYLEEVALNNNYCIELYSGNQIYSFNEKLNTCELNDKSYLKIKRLLINSSTDETIKTNDNYVVQSIRINNDTIVLIGTPFVKSALGAVVLRGHMIYFAIILLLAAFIVSYFVSRILNKPILRITDSARDMANGKYTPDENDYKIRELNELRDVLNYARSEIENTDQLRRDLLANVSHDLKTPLTMIKAYAEMVKDLHGNNKQKREENLDIIISETDRLNLLVNDILELSKMQNNIQEFHYEDYDLIAEINSLIEKFQIIKEIENYKFIINAPEKAIVNADKKQINQVIYNLVNNAINFTGNDLVVKINVIEKENNYLVEIIDTGKGLNKKEIPYIWNKYYKDEKNHRRYKTGTGLGLYIVKTILDAHGFNYGVNSKINSGSNFYFYVKKAN